jgi:hypothetical protein
MADTDARRRRWTVKGPFGEGWEVFHVAPDALVTLGPRTRRSTVGGRGDSAHALARRGPEMDRPPSRAPLSSARETLRSQRRPPPSRSRTFGTSPPGPRTNPAPYSWGSIRRRSGVRRTPGSHGALCQGSTSARPGRRGTRGRGPLPSLDPSRSREPVTDGGRYLGPGNVPDRRWRRALDREARAGFLPHMLPEVGQCVHRAALDPAGSATLYRQHRRGIYVSHDRAKRWRRIGRGLPDRFGAVVAGGPALPGVAFFGR